MTGKAPLRMAVKSVPAIAGLACLAVLLACAPIPDGPLADRVLPVEKRHAFLASQEADAPREIRTAFMDGLVVRGMIREWVMELYGRPDRITDLGWEYLDRKGNLILGVHFDHDKVDSVITVTRAP